MTPVANDGLDQLTAAQLVALRAVIDTIIPADSAPGGWAGGVEKLLREHGHDFMSWALPLAVEGLAQLDERAERQFARPFGDLDSASQTDIFAAALSDEPQPPPASPFDKVEHPPIDALITVAFEGYYAGTEEPAGWSVAGFSPVPAGVVPERSRDHRDIQLRPFPYEELAPYHDRVEWELGASGGQPRSPFAITASHERDGGPACNARSASGMPAR